MKMTDLRKYLLTGLGAVLMALSPANMAKAQTTAREYRDLGEKYWHQEDYTNAYNYFKKASDMGDGLSSFAIGNIYRYGQGRNKNYMLAAIYFQKAAEKGIAGSWLSKGYLYYFGDNSLPKDVKTAATYFRKSAELGEANGQQWMGYLYSRGEGVPKDRAQAIAWYQKAAAQGDKTSIDELRKLGFTATVTPTTKPSNVTFTKPKATLTWLSTATSVASKKYQLKVGIKSTSEIESVVVKLNGQKDRGIKTVSSDGYDMVINRNLTLVSGTNTIRIEVRNAGGTAVSERKISYVPINSGSSSNPVTNTVKTKEKRIALVMGNANYKNTDMQLDNPVNDADDVAAKLSSLGFTVIRSFDQSRQGMEQAISTFGTKAKDYDVALFFYAGHGIQYQGANYLVPIDAQLPSEEYVKYNCTDANLVLDMMESAGCKMKIVILDACRNNPFARSWNRSTTGGSGLGVMNAPKGTFIAFSTAPGDVALDSGNGVRNSPYTSALLETLDLPGLSITDFFQEVLERVAINTNEKQTPWTSNSFRGKFVFNPSK